MRPAPVLEIAANIGGRACRLGLNTFLGLSVVGIDDLPPGARKRCKRTAERLHPLGGVRLTSQLEVSLPVILAETNFNMTFNVVETDACGLGFVLGMDYLEKLGFTLQPDERFVTYKSEPLTRKEIMAFRKRREDKTLAAAGPRAVFTAKTVTSGAATSTAASTPNFNVTKRLEDALQDAREELQTAALAAKDEHDTLKNENENLVKNLERCCL